MAGNGASCGGFINVFKMAVGIDGFLNGGIALVGYHGLGHKQSGTVDVIPISQLFPNVICQTLGIISPVFLGNTHLAVLDLDAGFQIQQIGAQSGGGRATAALNQIVQLIYQEACFYFFGKGAQIVGKSVQVSCGFCQLTGLQYNQTLTGGQILGIDDMNVGEIFCGKGSALEAGGKTGTKRM